MMKLCIARLLVPLPVFANACAPSAGTQAHNTSAAEHLAAANEEDSRAAEHPSEGAAVIFAHSADIESVTELRENIRLGRVNVGRDAATPLARATIVFRASPGLTVEWLQRIVDCHLARNAAAGHDMREMAYCPLVTRGVAAKVYSARRGFAVDVRSGDPEIAAEIWKRAQQLEQSNDELS